MRRKLLALVVAMLFVAAEPVAAQALQKCSSSQTYVIASAQRQVTSAQATVTSNRGLVRLAQIGVNAAAGPLRSANGNLDRLNKQLHGFIAQEAAANRVKLLDLQVAEEKTQVAITSAQHALSQAQATADRAQAYLDLQNERLATAQDNLGRKQAELQRQQSRCSP